MSSNRWVAIDPDILTHPLVGAGQPVEPADKARGSYSRMEAWVWLICNASFADHTVINRGRKMTLQRGDLLGAWAFLAHTWNWSAKTVRAWVDRLIKDNMLRKRAVELQMEHNGGHEKEGTQEGRYYGNQSQVLSVVNYWRFQFEGHELGQPKGQPEGQAKGNQRATKGQHITKEQGDKGTLKEGEGPAAPPPRDDPSKSFWGKALNPDVDADVDFENGKLKLLNGARTAWLEKFGGDEALLDLALMETAKYVQPNSSRPMITQIEGSLAKIVREKLDKDTRYAKAASRPRAPAAAKPETAKIGDMVAEAMEKNRQKRGGLAR